MREESSKGQVRRFLLSVGRTVESVGKGRQQGVGGGVLAKVKKGENESLAMVSR